MGSMSLDADAKKGPCTGFYGHLRGASEHPSSPPAVAGQRRRIGDQWRATAGHGRTSCLKTARPPRST